MRRNVFDRINKIYRIQLISMARVEWASDESFFEQLIMDRDKALRKHLVELMQGGNAHLGFVSAVADLPIELRGAKPPGVPHSPWRLVEHMRIAQWDILEFSRNPRHKSPKFPD